MSLKGMKILGTVLAVMFAAYGVEGLMAHHSLTATYDTGTLVPLSGVITKVELINPHVKVDLAAKGSGGTVTTWTIEFAPPHALQRRNVELQLLKPGQQVTIESWLRKDGKREATGRTLVTADGKRLDVGDSLNWTMVTPAK